MNSEKHRMSAIDALESAIRELKHGEGFQPAMRDVHRAFECLIRADVARFDEFVASAKEISDKRAG